MTCIREALGKTCGEEYGRQLEAAKCAGGGWVDKATGLRQQSPQLHSYVVLELVLTSTVSALGLGLDDYVIRVQPLQGLARHPRSTSTSALVPYSAISLRHLLLLRVASMLLSQLRLVLTNHDWPLQSTDSLGKHLWVAKALPKVCHTIRFNPAQTVHQQLFQRYCHATRHMIQQ